MPASRRVLCLTLASIAAVAHVARPPAAAAQVVLGLPDENGSADKTPASEAIKAGMSGIRKLIVDTHTLITHRRLAPDGARRFAAEVKRHVDAMRPDPAAVSLAETLDEIAQGATAIAEPANADARLDGLDKIERALAHYPQLFDDPDWKPLR